MMNQYPVITIDGPSGSGKTTISKIIAKKLNWSLLESGQLYRLVAFLALKNNVSIIENNIVPFAKKVDFKLFEKKKNVYINSLNFKKLVKYLLN